MVSTRLLISKSTNRSTNPFVTVPDAPLTVGVTITLMFYSFFSSLVRCGQSEQQSLLFGRLSFFLLTLTRSGRLVDIRRSAYISKCQRILGVSFSWTDFWLCIYQLFLWSNLNSLHNSQWITSPPSRIIINIIIIISCKFFISSFFTEISSGFLYTSMYSRWFCVVFMASIPRRSRAYLSNSFET